MAPKVATSGRNHPRMLPESVAEETRERANQDAFWWGAEEKRGAGPRRNREGDASRSLLSQLLGFHSIIRTMSGLAPAPSSFRGQEAVVLKVRCPLLQIDECQGCRRRVSRRPELC